MIRGVPEITRGRRFKLVPTIPAFEALPKAAGLAEGVGLTRLRRTFRAAPKHEAKHVKAGLHLWRRAARALGVRGRVVGATATDPPF